MKSIPGARKSRGRPKVGSTPINVRLPPDELAPLDAFIAKAKEQIGRPEAIRRILANFLKRRGLSD
jgi:hypothetical protein